MALAKLSPEAPRTPAPVLPQVVAKTEYKDVAVHSDQIPINSLQQYVSGSAWNVDGYFSQVLTKDTELRELDIQVSAPLQQYHEVKNLELRVQSPLAQSYDSETHISAVQGAAIITYLVPNKGDMIVAASSDHQKFLIAVKNVERRSHKLQSVYLIDYEVISLVDETDSRMINLRQKVVRTSIFDQSRAEIGGSAILEEPLHAMQTKVKRAYGEITRAWWSSFFSQSYDTVVVPGQTRAIYDTWLMDYVFSITELEESEYVIRSKHLSLDGDRFVERGSVWKALLNRDSVGIDDVYRGAAFAPKMSFNKSSWLRGPAYFSLHAYIYPKVEGDEIASGQEQQPAVTDGQEWERQNPYDANTTVLHHGQPIVLIKPVELGKNYVFSDAFYDNVGPKSALEILLWQYLDRKSLDIKLLAELVKHYRNWAPLEKFYYGPALMLLAKETSRGIHLA